MTQREWSIFQEGTAHYTTYLYVTITEDGHIRHERMGSIALNPDSDTFHAYLRGINGHERWIGDYPTIRSAIEDIRWFNENILLAMKRHDLQNP